MFHIIPYISVPYMKDILVADLNFENPESLDIYRSYAGLSDIVYRLQLYKREVAAQ